MEEQRHPLFCDSLPDPDAFRANPCWQALAVMVGESMETGQEEVNSMAATDLPQDTNTLEQTKASGVMATPRPVRRRHKEETGVLRSLPYAAQRFPLRSPEGGVTASAGAAACHTSRLSDSGLTHRGASLTDDEDTPPFYKKGIEAQEMAPLRRRSSGGGSTSGRLALKLATAGSQSSCFPPKDVVSTSPCFSANYAVTTAPPSTEVFWSSSFSPFAGKNPKRSTPSHMSNDTPPAPLHPRLDSSVIETVAQDKGSQSSGSCETESAGLGEQRAAMGEMVLRFRAFEAS